MAKVDHPTGRSMNSPPALLMILPIYNKVAIRCVVEEWVSTLRKLSSSL